jgi:DNA repair exonuclease SbcCD nuclease subunit
MKVLFTADLHIKLGQKNVPVAWARNRYKELFSEISVHSTQVDLTILGGDIFDKLPNMEELELYFELVSSIYSMCIVYSGNHEALKKNTTFLTSLKSVTNKLNNKVKVIDDYYSYKGIDFIPYNKLKEYSPADIDFHSDILCTHVRGEIPPHVKPEVPLELFDRWKLVLAGDLHSYENSQKNILYPGSPITTSFHRNRVDTGVIILDTDTLGHRWIKLDLPQLIRKTIKAGEPMPPGERDHIIYEVEGDMAQLAAVAGHDLIDKKVVKRDSDSALILDANMTIAEEVAEYLRYVLNLNEASIQSVLKELQEYV